MFQNKYHYEPKNTKIQNTKQTIISKRKHTNKNKNKPFLYRVSLAIQKIQPEVSIEFTVLYLSVPPREFLTEIVQKWLPYLIEFLDRAPGGVFKLFQF